MKKAFMFFGRSRPSKHRAISKCPFRTDHIEREIIVLELSDDERICPCCGELRNEIGREISSEQLEFIPSQLKTLQHLRVRYACRACEENVVTATQPAQPIEKDLPGPGLSAHTMLPNYGDYPSHFLEDFKGYLQADAFSQLA